jgi:pimeloyl-ACP methyl ester carboxylesterase
MAGPSGFKSEAARDAYVRLYDEAIGQSAVPVVESDVATSFGATHVLTAGDPAKPPLVALHAKSFGATMWLPLLPTLTVTHHVHLLDAVGDLNKSVATAVLSSPERVASWVDESLGALGIERAAFVGASIGCWMGALFANAHPEKVERFVMLCPGGIVAGLKPSAMVSMLWNMGPRRRPEGAAKVIDSMAAPATRPRLREDPWRPIIQQFVVGMGGYRLHWREPRPAKCSLDRVGAASFPLLVLIGRQEALHDAEAIAAAYRAQMPRADVEVVDDANHLIFIDQQALVADRLRAFLGHDLL